MTFSLLFNKKGDRLEHLTWKRVLFGMEANAVYRLQLEVLLVRPSRNTFTRHN